MKRILLAGLILWSTLSSAALPLKTRGQNDASTTGIDTLRLEAPNSQITTIGDQKVLVETGNENLLINPSFEHSNFATGWTIPTGSGFFSEETTKIRHGKKSVYFDHSVSTGGGGTIYQQVDPPASKRGQTYEYSIQVYGDSSAATSLKVCVLDGPSQTQTQCQTVTRENIYRRFTFNLVPPASGLTGIGVIGDPANRFYVDDGYVGPSRNIGSGVPNNVFSAKVSSAGVVSDENEDWISGNCTVSTATFTCTFLTQKFNIAPNCTMSPVTATGGIVGKILTTTSSNLTAITFVSTSGVDTAAAWVLSCTRAAGDFIQPAITPNQWNSELKSAGAITIGATITAPTKGTATITNDRVMWGRKGDLGVFSYEYKHTAVGTATAGSGDYLFTLPNGLKFDSNKISFFTGGGANSTNFSPSIRGSANVSDGSTYGFTGVVVPYDATRFRVYMIYTNGSAVNRGFWASSVQSFANTGISFSADFTAPIEGWTENQNAPQLLGSVTSNANSALRVEYAFFSCSSSSSLGTVSSPNVFTAIGNVSGGGCAVTIASGVYSAAPHCDISLFSNASGTEIKLGAAPTQTSVLPTCTTTSAGCAVWQGSVKCTGPR